MTQTELASDRPRILVVDDSRIVRATVKKHLAASFDIIEEADGEAGWERLMADNTILVLMSDLSMPRLDGFGLLARVRKSSDARIRHTPVIIISGEEDAETKQLAVERGANDFVTKSTDRAEMLARVQAAAKLARTARELRASEVNQARTATTEAQTGLATPHMFQLHGEKLMAHALRVHGEATLLVFEIDAYPALCERVGSAVAEQVVSLVAKTVASRLRKEEILARLEGPAFRHLPVRRPGWQPALCRAAVRDHRCGQDQLQRPAPERDRECRCGQCHGGPTERVRAAVQPVAAKVGPGHCAGR